MWLDNNDVQENLVISPDSCSSFDNDPSSPWETADRAIQQAKDASSGSLNPPPDYKATSTLLLRKLLELPNPRMDTKIVNVLLLDGVMDIFMSHMTCFDEKETDVKPTPDELGRLSLVEKLQLASRSRKWDDAKAIERSYHAMELLCGTSSNHYRVQDTCLDTIVDHLFSILLPNSNGNFNHFGKVFQHFVRRHPVEMLERVIMRNNATYLFDYLLPNANEGAITESILVLLTAPSTKDVVALAKRRAAFERLDELDFIKILLEAFHLRGFSAYVSRIKEMTLRLIEEMSQMEHSEFLFKVFYDETKGPATIRSLLELIAREDRGHTRHATILVLKALVNCGTPPSRSSTIAQPIHGPLYNISLHIRNLISHHISDICILFIKDRPCISTKIRPLTLADMDLLDIFYQSLSDASDQIQALDAVPVAFWKMFVNSFFEKNTCNMYHTLFYRIFRLVLRINHERPLIILIRKQKLLTRLIETYQDKSRHTDNRGFILLILNHLRLSADADDTTLVHRMVTLHPRFQEFLPELRDETFAQVEERYSWRLVGGSRPAPHLGPSPPIRPSQLFSSSYNGTTLPLMGGPGDHPEEHLGIDLGSDYAYCLGFDELAPVGGSRAPSRSVSRGPSRPVSPLDPSAFVFESLTAEH
ncbi:hypothetical protein BCR43DRAFT_491331 [Syncephalastrum racemosum]|uniref:Uncharacterized protein n=1 Tax=Syncephalastrum racemosum TaxID=13706 RepID=A0A1X2HBS3_SYNRA|nr:hypothetical protein BCR43DRAFT_491331 [Syncephalastrum racemosum]